MNLTIHNFVKNKYNETFESSPIEYDFLDTQLGILNIAYNSMGICHLSFEMSQNKLIKQLKYEWPKSSIKNNPIAIDLKNRILQYLDHQLVEKQSKISSNNAISIVLKGTIFQIQVWRQLTRIPIGMISNYSQIAKDLNIPRATRAISNAIAINPIAILIPCHRVIRKDGHLGGYRWGNYNKIRLLKLENQQFNIPIQA